MSRLLIPIKYTHASTNEHARSVKEQKDDEQLKSELICIKLLISQEANKSFNDAKKDLNCNSRSCVIRKLCEGGDLDEQILEIHNAATACDPDAANEDDSP
ncbi:hypothetical protein HPB51_024399 [Rhipicephalus microplus]|uniref:Uncharacterized protein n=1 Tax=Rhipicephalus microplus TaxID=6941 RepID=A0A9J6EJ16_RHIMP|nr:hypothetical protein HPB51_024399 [Rhipicephalus microplus]